MSKSKTLIHCPRCKYIYYVSQERCPNCSSCNPYKPKNFELGYQANKMAMEFEKINSIQKAIENYEEAVLLNFEGNYPYKRLAIIYRRNKDYKNEIRILEHAIKVFTYLSYHSERGDILSKLKGFNDRLVKAEKYSLSH